MSRCRIQAHVPKDLKEYLLRIQQEKGLNESGAICLVVAEHRNTVVGFTGFKKVELNNSN